MQVGQNTTFTQIQQKFQPGKLSIGTADKHLAL